MERARIGVGLVLLSLCGGVQAVRDYRYDQCPHCVNDMAYRDSFDDMDVGFFGQMRAMGRRMRETMRRFDQELAELFGRPEDYQVKAMGGTTLTAEQEADRVVLSGAIELNEKQLKKLRGRLSEEDTKLTVSLPDGAITVTMRRVPGATQLAYGMTFEQREVMEDDDDMDERWTTRKKMKRGRYASDRAHRREQPSRRSFRQESYAASTGYMRVPGTIDLNKTKITYNRKARRLIITMPMVSLASEGTIILPDIEG